MTNSIMTTITKEIGNHKITIDWFLSTLEKPLTVFTYDFI